MKEGPIEHQEEERVSLYTKAEELKHAHPETHDLVLAVHDFIQHLPNRYQPTSIIESRFTSAEDAYEKGMLSCGAITNISAAILRHAGLQVQLIHGECAASVDHAWISVYAPETDAWVDYDLTQNNPTDMSGHIEKARTQSWDDIREQILDDHATLRARRIARKEAYHQTK